MFSKSSKQVIERETIFSSKRAGGFAFLDIPDADESAIDLMRDCAKYYDRPPEFFFISEGDEEFQNIVRQFTEKLKKIAKDDSKKHYEALEKRLRKDDDKDDSLAIKDTLMKLYNRVMFFRFDEHLLSLARYILAKYAVFQMLVLKEHYEKLTIGNYEEVLRKELSTLETSFFDTTEMEKLISELEVILKNAENEKQTVMKGAAKILDDNGESAQAIGNELDANVEGPDINFEDPTLTAVVEDESSTEKKLSVVEEIKRAYDEKQKSFIEGRREFNEYVRRLFGIVKDKTLILHDVFTKQTSTEIKDEELLRLLQSIKEHINEPTSTQQDRNDWGDQVKRIESELRDVVGDKRAEQLVKTAETIRSVEEDAKVEKFE